MTFGYQNHFRFTYSCPSGHDPYVCDIYDAIADRPRHDIHPLVPRYAVKWNEPQAFGKLILRPGVMHIVQNVCGCIGQLMMGLGLADLIGSAFGGVGSIMAQGKPWVHAMRSFRMVSSVLLQSFLQTGFKTWDEICEYLEKARSFSSLATTTMQDTSHGIASKCLYYCMPWQRMTYSLEHLSADTRRAAGMQCRPTSSGSRRQYRLGKVD